MKFKVLIKDKDGEMITEVLDRQDSICSNIKKVTNAVGQEVSDEHIGPECDKVEEVAID